MAMIKWSLNQDYDVCTSKLRCLCRVAVWIEEDGNLTWPFSGFVTNPFLLSKIKTN